MMYPLLTTWALAGADFAALHAVHRFVQLGFEPLVLRASLGMEITVAIAVGVLGATPLGYHEHSSRRLMAPAATILHLVVLLVKAFVKTLHEQVELGL
jgi:hypothetical protein